MKIDRDTKFWVVTDPTNVSELIDILFECDLHRFEMQIRGGLVVDHDNPTIHFDATEAMADAMARLESRKVKS